MQMNFIRKHLYWDIYGVRSFPYRGKRKYFPCIFQDYDGTIMIRNDVFGLTISQFERDFKALLIRRKKRESEIQNIRFPDKTSSQYIEYLKYGDDTVQGCTQFRELLNKDGYFRCLVQMVGTERDFRTRQRMFILQDTIRYKLFPWLLRQISSGSLAEGIDLPGSDEDQMFVFQYITVLDDIEHLPLCRQNTTFLLEYDIKHPGFCMLKLALVDDTLDNSLSYHIVTYSLLETEDGLYLSTERFLQFLLDQYPARYFSTHGPCIVDPKDDVDYAYCLRIKYWPRIALCWTNRHRKGQWPSCRVMNAIIEEGCLLVPIAPRNSDDNLLWRISFSMAEKRLTHSMNYTQLLCYVLLKLTLKNIINTNEQVKNLLCSYFLKTTVFWLSEEISINTFKISNLSQCYFLCIDKLVSFVSNCCCSNYFIPQQNMFIGKIDECNKKPLLNILKHLRNQEFDEIMKCIYRSRVTNEINYTSLNNMELSINLDFLFYRCIGFFYVENLESACKSLRYIKSVTQSETSEFLLSVLHYFHTIINQRIPQMLVLPICKHTRNTIIRCCHRYLTAGTKSDYITGWLLHASFYYVLGDYKNTLQIVDAILSRCTPDMIHLRKQVYTTENKFNYIHKIERYMSLNQKMRHTTFDAVFYIKKSTLIPQELKLEVQDYPMWVPPVVMSQCLQFLCHHHLGDTNKKQRALRELELTINERYCLHDDLLPESLVILGVCNEVSGDKNAAYKCYNSALNCEDVLVFSSATKQRLSNLFLI